MFLLEVLLEKAGALNVELRNDCHAALGRQVCKGVSGARAGGVFS